MRRPRRLTRLALLLALAASMVAVAAPARADTHRAQHCTKHAWGAGTVVWTCASLHFSSAADIVSAHGEARHTNGPGPVRLRITAVRLYHYNPTFLIHAGDATPFETGHAYRHSDACGYSPAGRLTATLYALVGVDAIGQGRSFQALRHQTWGVTSQPCGSVSLSPSA
jgi:hypothetical protein